MRRRRQYVTPIAEGRTVRAERSIAHGEEAPEIGAGRKRRGAGIISGGYGGRNGSGRNVEPECADGEESENGFG